MLEHLALFGLGRPGEQINGLVDQTITMFRCVGDQATVVDFLGTMTRQLADPPVARLDVEKEVLRAEQEQKPPSAERTLLRWRYGAQTYGLAGEDAHGLRTLSHDNLVDWSHRYATRGNSVLWMTGSPPSGLKLNLLEGAPVPAPDPWATVLPRFPAFIQGPNTRISLHTLVGRSSTSRALADILQVWLTDELRTNRSVAYSPQVDYRPLTGDTARILATSDLLAGRQSDGVRPFLAALQEIADGYVSDEVLEWWRERNLRNISELRNDDSLVGQQALQLLLKEEAESLSSMISEMEAVEAKDVEEQAQAALSRTLAMIPTHVRVSREPWSAAPATVLEPITGAEFHPIVVEGGQERIVMGEEGLTYRSGDNHLTVPREAAVGVLSWRDGRRDVLGRDGNSIVVEPSLWEDGYRIVSEIDRMWGGLTVPMPARPVTSIPRPQRNTASPKADESSSSVESSNRSKDVGAGLLALLVLGPLAVILLAIVTGRSLLLVPGIVIAILAGRSLQK
jgi:zinc protease